MRCVFSLANEKIKTSCQMDRTDDKTCFIPGK